MVLFSDVCGSCYYIIVYIESDRKLVAAAQTGIVFQLHG